MASAKLTLFMALFITISDPAEAQTADLPPRLPDSLLSVNDRPELPISATKWTVWKRDDFEISYPPKWFADSVGGVLVGFFLNWRAAPIRFMR